MLRETRAAEVVYCRPWCEPNLKNNIKAGGHPAWRVRDLVEIVAAALMD